jgi:hypothetical protein
MSQSNDTCGDREQEHAIPKTGLVKASVFLAVFLEVIPFEADIIYSSPVTDSILFALVVKATCLIVIFTPLMLYVKQNGWSALRFVRGRVAIVVVIAAINLGHNVLMFGGKALGW